MVNRRGLMLFVTAAALAAGLGLGGCSSSGDKRVEMPTMSMLNAPSTVQGADGVTMSFDVLVKNPYKKPMPLLSTAYAINADGKSVATGREDLRVKNVPPKVEPGKTQALPVIAKVTNKQVLAALASGGGTAGVPRGGDVVPYAADVFVMVDSPTAGPITLIAKSTGSFTIPPAMSLEMQGVLFESAGGPGDGWIGVALVNRNNFAVQVQSLVCDVTFDRRIMATARLAVNQRFEPGASVELNLPMSIQPPLAADARPGAGSVLVFEVRGVVEGTSDRGQLSVPFEASGKVTVAE